ncbi:MAG TPA: endo alpha-1,4 polygalactosaminidase [Labilithrix sp.]
MFFFVETGARAEKKGPPATAFFYGEKTPDELLAHYDRVVLEPDHFAAAPPSPRAETFAYVSVGEIDTSRSWSKEVPQGVVLGRNAAWGSQIADVRGAAWSTFLLDHVIEPLWAKGWRGFFLDTLDSYEQVLKSAGDRDAAARGIGKLITTLASRHPDAKILLNRGFAVLPYSPKVQGFVVESLFSTCDAKGQVCKDETKQESDALVAKLREVEAKYALPISVIDYAPAANREARRALAAKIAKLGFSPWVSSPKLDEIGAGPVEIVPRRVLVVYKSNDEEGYLGVQDASVLIAPILEWLGYAVDYADVREPLPSSGLVGRYAGIVTLVPEGVDSKDPWKSWLLAQMKNGIRVAFMEGFGFEPDPDWLAALGLSAPKANVKPPMRITTQTPYFGFETKPEARIRERPPAFAERADLKTLLRIEDSDGGKWDGGILAPWGGVVFIPYMIQERLEGERSWILDPYKFITDALQLPPIPAPDVTTEGGRRIFTVHVDGDAFVSRAERQGAPFTAKLVLEEILEKYDTPQTVSIVEGEVGPKGLYPQYTKELEGYARKIFALPYVEMGTHLYSHPFEWELAEAGDEKERLPIPNYKYDVVREIKGSTDYINTLAPPGKHVKVVQWSGSCSPSEKPVALATKLGLFNVNGGGSTRTYDLPSLTHGTAMGIPKADGVYQVFAPVENENVYTNDWHGPFDGYRHAIETFVLNDSPRRITTLTIYYHFYSASKTASFVALKEVYEWAMKQETTPLYLSEYAAKVIAFQKATLAKRDGVWELGNLGELRTVRLAKDLGWPDLRASTGVGAVRDVPQGRYVSLTEARDRGAAILALRETPDTGAHVVHVNGRVRAWQAKSDTSASLRVTADVGLELTVAAPNACKLLMPAHPKAKPKRTITKTEGVVTTRFDMDELDTGDATLDCSP